MRQSPNRTGSQLHKRGDPMPQDEGAVHRSEIFPLMSVQDQKRRIDAPDEFAACPLCL
jgi:hypothetical protein